MTDDAGRIASLDTLRGLGVLGILAVNASAFALPYAAHADPALTPQTHASQVAWAIMHVFFEAKFVTLFSLLFGASVLLVGGERRDPEKSPVLWRRLGWLAVFGVLHGAAIWFGDILLLYAVAGSLAALARSWAPKRLFTVGALLLLGVILLEIASPVSSLFIPQARVEIAAYAAKAAAGMPAEIAAYRGGLASALEANFKSWLILQVPSLIFYVWNALGLMMIGMGLLRTGVFQARRGAGLYVVLLLLGAAALGVIGWSAWGDVEAGQASPTWRAYVAIANATLAPVVTLGYLALVALLLKASALRGVTSALANVGKMAFTNYLTQSVIMTTIFWSGRGFGLFGQLDRAELWTLVVTIWVLQIAWSQVWMHSFRYGPLEWVWRSLSHARRLPIR
ncbi:DUF418 domain-containing protein, partial [Caulobacter sp. 17J65-9]|uniref:DUF418 domain-containing protein n=1 Tax=Caulobacter sp. 17J65-9 TaxID=2709382 RepID=UPI0013CB482C